MIKDIVILLSSVLLLSLNAEASIIEKICSENAVRASNLHGWDSEEESILNLSLNVNTSFEVSIDCKSGKLIHYLKTYDTSGDLKRQTIRTGTWSWDSKTEIITVRSDYAIPNKKVSLMIKPLISNKTVLDCDHCYSLQTNDGKGDITEKWYDKNGREISKPKKINLGKKVIFLKNQFNLSLVAGYISSKIDVKNEQKVKAAMMSGDSDLVENIADNFDGNLDQISSTFSANGNLNFNVSSFLFRGDFLVNNETIEDEKSFYQAQVFDYNQVFSYFSKP